MSKGMSEVQLLLKRLCMTPSFSFTGLIAQLNASKSLNLTLELVSTCYRSRCEKIISTAEKSRLCFERSELKLKKFAPSFKRIKRGQKDCKSAPDF